MDFFTDNPAEQAKAGAICAGCSVVVECIALAMTLQKNVRYGIAGARWWPKGSGDFGRPVGLCRHRDSKRNRGPTCEKCWAWRMRYCNGCLVVPIEKGGKCLPCWREQKRQNAARWRAKQKAAAGA